MGGTAQGGQQQQEKKNAVHTGPGTISRTMPRDIETGNRTPFPFAGPRLIPFG
jgi:hypothetical protein